MKTFLIFLLIAVARSQDVSDDICEGINIDLIPHPDSCSLFVLCVFELPQVFACAPNQIFDYNRQICVPGDPVTCEIFTQGPPDTTVDVFPTLPTVSPTLPSITPSLPTLPTTTTQPLWTTPSNSPTFSFPTIFPPFTTTPSPPDTTTSGNLPPGNPALCVNNNFRFVADPNACYRYFYCLFGLPIPGECDHDRIFSERFRGCVFGDWDTCTPNFPIIVVTPTPRP